MEHANELELGQFPVTARSGGGSERARNLCLCHASSRVVDAIWLDLGALNQG